MSWQRASTLSATLLARVRMAIVEMASKYVQVCTYIVMCMLLRTRVTVTLFYILLFCLKILMSVLKAVTTAVSLLTAPTLSATTTAPATRASMEMEPSAVRHL